MARTLVMLLALVPAVAADDWPHWRGSRRNGHVAEECGWNGRKWPPAGPAWTARVGAGSTSPLVVEGRLYMLGWNDGRDTVVCLDAATGRELWKTSYACPQYGRQATGDEGLYAGPTSTPEFDQDTGLLYTLSVDGDLNCWDTRSDGRRVWGLNLYQAYQVPRRPKPTRIGHRDYGYTTAPLVWGDWLIVEAGAAEGNLVAFDKRTGERRWVSQSKDPAGHSGGLAPMTIEGIPCLAVFTLRHLLVVRLDAGREGQTVAESPWSTDYANSIVTPAVHGDSVLVTAGYNHQTIRRLRITLRGAETVWEQPEFSKVCTPVVHNGHVYWSWQKVVCLDFETGRKKWETPRSYGDPGSCLVTSDGRLVVWSRRGRLSLLETADRSPDRAVVLAETSDLCRTDAWPHLVLSGGRLYLKDRHGSLHCVEVE